METTLTKFQREFRKAREVADRGMGVFITHKGTRYVFMKDSPERNPFAGFKGVFGAPKRFKDLKDEGRQK